MTAQADPFNLPTLRFDFARCNNLIDDITTTLDDIDGVETLVDPDSGPARDALASANDKKRRQEVRSTNAGYARDLLRAAAHARTLAAEIEEEYWRLKGHQDPRFAG